MAKTVTFGNVCKRQDGKGTYIKIFKDVTLKKGQFVNVDDPSAKLEFLFNNKHITKEAYETRKAKLAEFDSVVYELSVKQD